MSSQELSLTLAKDILSGQAYLTDYTFNFITRLVDPLFEYITRQKSVSFSAVPLLRRVA